MMHHYEGEITNTTLKLSICSSKIPFLVLFLSSRPCAMSSTTFIWIQSEAQSTFTDMPYMKDTQVSIIYHVCPENQTNELRSFLCHGDGVI